jgi:hypothetical protein
MASGETLLIFTPLANEPPATIFATIDVRNGHPVLDFDANTDEEAVFTGILPRRYGGGGLTVHTYWSFTSATSNQVSIQGAIERMDVSSLDIDDTGAFAAFQAATGTAPATNGQIIQINLTFTSGAQMDSLAAGEMFRLKIRRDADGSVATDSVTGDAELLGLEIKET